MKGFFLHLVNYFKHIVVSPAKTNQDPTESQVNIK